MYTKTQVRKDVTEAQSFLQQLQELWKKCSPAENAYFVQPYIIFVRRVP
jgi:uncharacterized protein YqcC (DUF446 family)